MSKRIVILGAKESGTGAALLAKAKGLDVFVSDYGEIPAQYKEELVANEIAFEEKTHTPEKILNADEVIKSPGIPDFVPIMQQVLKRGIPVISELEFAYRYSKAKFIAITGSNGKTTTTLLTHHLMVSAGVKVGLAGNVGYSLAKQVIKDDVDWYVVEVSSFQLDNMYEFKADVAILLNITPDHLDRYDNNFSKYADAKFKIANNQTKDDYLISFYDDDTVRKGIKSRGIESFQLAVSLQDRMLNGAYESNNTLVINVDNHITRLFKIDDNFLPLVGKHNKINTMCAVLATTVAGVNEQDILKGLSRFKHIPHRLEDAGMVNRVRYINDSKATNVESVKYALESFENPIIWIAGGVDKGNDYSVIHELVYEKVKAVICLGKDNTRLHEAFDDKVQMIIDTEDMNQAVRIANEVSDRGDLVLLSPACASFDLFKNYEDRGDQFKTAIKALERSQRKLYSILL